MRGKWDCLVCTHSCFCATCQSSHDDDIDRLKKILQKEAAEYQDSKFIKKEVITEKAKNVSEGEITEKYGVKILTKGKRKTYLIDKSQLNLEYISNHELANVTRLRNLYLNQRKKKEVTKQEPISVTSTEIESKAKKEEPKPAPATEIANAGQYEQYANPMMNGGFPVYPMGFPMASNYNMMGGNAMPYNVGPSYFYPIPYGFGYPPYMAPAMNSTAQMQYAKPMNPNQLNNTENK